MRDEFASSHCLHTTRSPLQQSQGQNPCVQLPSLAKCSLFWWTPQLPLLCPEDLEGPVSLPEKKNSQKTCYKIAWVHATYRSLNFLQMTMQAKAHLQSVLPPSLFLPPFSSSPSAGPRVCCMYSLASRVLAASENLQGQHHTLTAPPETLPWHFQNLQDLSSGDKLWNPNSFSLLLLCM